MIVILVNTILKLILDIYLIVKKMLGGRLLSIHNIRFLIRLTEDLKEAIKEDRVLEYKEEFLRKYTNQ